MISLKLPNYYQYKSETIIGMGSLAGIGFTMSIFLQQPLHLMSEQFKRHCKNSILVSLVLSMALSGFIFQFLIKNNRTRVQKLQARYTPNLHRIAWKIYLLLKSF